VIEFIDSYNEEYEAFNQGHPKGTIFQSYLWHAVKTAWQWRAVVVRKDGKITGEMSVLIRRVPGTKLSLLYSTRGPVCDPHDKETLQELTEGIRKLAKEEHAYLLSIDPDIPFEDEEFKEIMKSLGYNLKPVAIHFENIQPQFVVRLSLTGKTPEEVLANLKGKTRYNIRVAERKGVEVRVCDESALDDFVRLMEVTGERDDFTTRPKEYFAQMMRALGEHVRLYMAYSDGEAIAGTICAQYGNKTWYLYGASSNSHREKMPNYLVQWNMITWAMENGCDVYDFRGISGTDDPNHPLAGLWRFKSGWGAEKTQFVGEFEYIFNPAIYKFMKFALPKAQSLGGLLRKAKKLLH